MKRPLAALLILTTYSVCYAQDDCDCRRALTRMITTVETSYPGFNEKTPDKLLYTNFKENLDARSSTTSDPECVKLLKEYVSFFRDGHISIFASDDETGEKTAVGKADKCMPDMVQFAERIRAAKDPLEGIWSSFTYKVGTTRQDSMYTGFIIDADTAFWKPGQVKFRLYTDGTADFYMRDHSLIKENWKLVDGWILSFSGANYIRELPIPALTEEDKRRRLDEVEGFYFKKLTDATSLLCISSFRHEFLERIGKLIESNREAIESCENLIIDIRNNGGGVYEGYSGLYPYILTNSLRGLGQEFLVTPTLLREIEGWYEGEDGKETVKRMKEKFNGKTGRFVNPDTSDVCIDTIKRSVRSPKQVVILVNKGTASSAEAFALDARQSKKVKIMGVPTYGALDYGSACFFDFGCRNYKLMLPTWRSARLPDFPIDNIGIQPDFFLDKSVKDWVRFCVDYLEEK